MILNDHLHILEEDPEGGRRIAEAIKELPINNAKPVWIRGKSCSYGYAIETHHADGISICAVGGNVGKKIAEVFYCYDFDKLEILKKVADQFGYRLVKKKDIGHKDG